MGYRYSCTHITAETLGQGRIQGIEVLNFFYVHTLPYELCILLCSGKTVG